MQEVDDIKALESQCHTDLSVMTQVIINKAKVLDDMKSWFEDIQKALFSEGKDPTFLKSATSTTRLSAATSRKVDGADEIIYLNIGGKYKSVYRSVLLKSKDKEKFGTNILSSIFEPRWNKYLLRDKHGRIYLDLEEEWLDPWLEYLRYNQEIVSLEGSHVHKRRKIQDIALSEEVQPRIFDQIQNCIGYLHCKNIVELRKMEPLFPDEAQSFLTTAADFQKATKLINIPEQKVLKLKYVANSFQTFYANTQAMESDCLILFTDTQNRTYGAFTSGTTLTNIRSSTKKLVNDNAFFFCLNSGDPVPHSRFTNSPDYNNHYYGSYECLVFAKAIGNRSSGYNEPEAYLYFHNTGSNGRVSFYISTGSGSSNSSISKLGFFTVEYVNIEEASPNSYKITTTNINNIQSPLAPASSMLVTTEGQSAIFPLANSIVESINKIGRYSQKIKDGEINFMNDLQDFTNESDNLLFYQFEIYGFGKYDPLKVFPSQLEIITFSTLKEGIQDRIAKIKQLHSDSRPGLPNSDGTIRPDPILYLDAEGEKICILKSVFLETFPGSTIAVRLSGTWQEQETDLDEQGYMMVHSSGKEVKQLIAYAREVKLASLLDSETVRTSLKVPAARSRIMAAVLDELCIDGVEHEII